MHLGKGGGGGGGMDQRRTKHETICELPRLLQLCHTFITCISGDIITNTPRMRTLTKSLQTLIMCVYSELNIKKDQMRKKGGVGGGGGGEEGAASHYGELRSTASHYGESWHPIHSSAVSCRHLCYVASSWPWK